MADLMTPKNALESIERPDAPYELGDAEADEWRVVVNSMPADHFMPANYGLLIQYCRHKVASITIDQLIQACRKRKKFDLGEYDRLLKMQQAETASINRLLRSMRLTQQSVMRAETTKHPKGGSKMLEAPPWATADDADE
jgi:hypothetical protein